MNPQHKLISYQHRCGHTRQLEVHKNAWKSAEGRAAIKVRIQKLTIKDCAVCLYVPPYVDYRMRTYFEDSFCLSETEKSLQCDIRVSRIRRTKGWVAKSQLSTLSELQKPGDYGALVISHWLAVTMKLIPEGYLG